MEEPQSSCCYCIEPITSEQSVTILSCNHKFHTICINQDSSKICPLCRLSISSKKSTNTTIEVPQYDSYVWLFGSFVNISSNITKRKNYMIYEFDSKKYATGYFWRLFDDNISKIIENDFQNNVKSNIEIGTSVYTLSNTGLTIKKNIDCHCIHTIQQNVQNKTRPVIRILWTDAIKNLLIIGIHDMKFFEKSFVYINKESMGDDSDDSDDSDNNNDNNNNDNNNNDNNNFYKLFDMDNQKIINKYYNHGLNMKKIIIDNIEFTVDINNNMMISTNQMCVIEIFNGQQLVSNY